MHTNHRRKRKTYYRSYIRWGCHRSKSLKWYQRQANKAIRNSELLNINSGNYDALPNKYKHDIAWKVT